MGSSKSQSPKPSKAVSTPLSQPDLQAESPVEPVRPAAKPTEKTMDQYSESTTSISASASSHIDSVPASSQPNTPAEMTADTSQSIAPSGHPATSTLVHGRQIPIPPASEPMQYRAIGLIRAKYQPSDDQFTRGDLVTDDGCTFGAVLLGRVMSLVKKHLDLNDPHLWVVYPRTREKHRDLHVQIVGVWEPETLDKEDLGSLDESEGEPSVETEDASMAIAPEESDETSALDDTHDTEPSHEDPESAPVLLQPPAMLVPPKPPRPPQPSDEPVPPISREIQPEDGYFSIRGEIVHQSTQEQRITVKIEQSPRRTDQEARSFKLTLTGNLEGRVVGHFWDLLVHREETDLVIQEGNRVGVVRPKRYPKKPKGFDKKKMIKKRQPSKKPSHEGGSESGFYSSKPTRHGGAATDPVKPKAVDVDSDPVATEAEVTPVQESEATVSPVEVLSPEPIAEPSPEPIAEPSPESSEAVAKPSSEKVAKSSRKASSKKVEAPSGEVPNELAASVDVEDDAEPAL